MEVDYAEEEVCCAWECGLEVDPLVECAEVVAQMWNAGGLNAGENCLGGRRGSGEEAGGKFEEAMVEESVHGLVLVIYGKKLLVREVWKFIFG